MSASLFTYRARVLGWIDGDTVDVLIDVGFKMFIEQRVRLAGINTPEISSGDEDERRRGRAAKEAAVKMAPAGKTIVTRTYKSGNDKYGRYLADVILDDGKSVAAELIAAGHGAAYDGGAR